MDYRQPIEPEIVMLMTISIFGFRNRILSASVQRPNAFEKDREEFARGLEEAPI
jgi:hypothetical protein